MVHIDEIISKLQSLSNEEKLRVLDAILTDLAKPNNEIDRVWMIEARKRWSCYKAGRLRTIPFEELMRKYNR